MTPPAPPGWYRDPSGRTGRMYWDGTQWCAKRKTGFWVSISGLGYPLAAEPMTTPPAPGWYPNSSGSTGQMYWDGTRWYDTKRKRGFWAFTFGAGLPLHDSALRWAIHGFILSWLMVGGAQGAYAVIAGLIARYRANRGTQNQYDPPQLTILTATIAIVLGLLDIAIAVVALLIWTH
jgi:hypothetical protein